MKEPKGDAFSTPLPASVVVSASTSSWEGIEKTYKIMCDLSHRLNLHCLRTKFIDVQKANLTYRKQRKHQQGQTRKITRRLLELLAKILKEIRKMERRNEGAEKLLTTREINDIDIITKMFRQRKNHFQSKDRKRVFRIG